MDDGIGLAEVLLGLPGFRVLGVTESDVEVVVRIETTAARAFCRACGVRAEPQDRRRVDDPRSGLLRAAGSAGVEQAAVALPRAAVLGADVDRGFRARRCSGGADASGRCRGVPPGRRERPPGEPTRGRARGVLVDDHERGRRARHPAGRRSRPDRPGHPAGRRRDLVPGGHAHARDGVRDRAGRSRAARA